MEITFENTGTEQTYVSAFYTQLDVGDTVTVSRTPSQLDDLTLKALIESGDLTVTATVLEPGDTVSVYNLDPALYSFLPIHTDLSRPLPTAVNPGTAIWNSDDSFTNVSDGTNWYDPTGLVT